MRHHLATTFAAENSDGQEPASHPLLRDFGGVLGGASDLQAGFNLFAGRLRCAVYQTSQMLDELHEVGVVAAPRVYTPCSRWAGDLSCWSKPRQTGKRGCVKPDRPG